MISSVTLLIFSPTGSTRRVVTRIGNALCRKIAQVDLMRQNIEKHVFKEHDFVVVGVPVYGGRVPALALQALRNFRGTATPVVSLVSYGNRAIDDALLELNDLLNEQSFKILGSAAFVAQHSIANEIGKGRPDSEDHYEIEEFVTSILDKYKKIPKADWQEITVPGNHPYKETKQSSIVPQMNEQCVKCKVCISKCPVGAISPEGTDPGKCFLCMRCIAVCPRKARELPAEYRNRVLEYLKQTCPERNNNLVFI